MFIQTRTFLTRGDGRHGRPAGRCIPGYILNMIFRIFWIRGVFWVELGLIMYERTIYIHILSYASIAVLTLLHKAQEVLHNVLG